MVGGAWIALVKGKATSVEGPSTSRWVWARLPGNLLILYFYFVYIPTYSLKIC